MKNDRWWIPFLLIGLVIVAVYGKSARYPFVYFDDNALIINNITYLADPHTLIDAFKEDVFRSNSSDAYYRPLLTLSFMADALIGGLSPVPYHVTNILIHLIAVWLAYLLLFELGYERETALISALVYAVHPVLTQATGWVPGRNDSLLAVFAFLSVILFVRYARKPRIMTFTAHIAFFAAAMFTKETALVLWVLFPASMWISGGHGRIKKSGWAAFAVSWTIITAVWFLMRRSAFDHPAMNSIPDMGLSLWRNMPALIQFIGKALIPANLSVLPVIRDTTFLYGIISCALIAVLFFVTRKKEYRRIAFGAAWFLLFLLPSFIRPNPDIPADFIEHRMYAPFFGVLIVMLELFPLKTLRARPRWFSFAGTVMIIACSIITFQYLDVFSSRLDFWQNAAANSPHYPLSRRNFGAMLYMEGMIERAETEYLSALRLNPHEPMVHNNLGLIYMQRGEYPRAEEAFKKELEFNPGYDNALYNYGLLEARRNNYVMAVDMWKKAVAVNPDYGDAYDSLVRYYLYTGDRGSAIRYYKEMKQRSIFISSDLSSLIRTVSGV